MKAGFEIDGVRLLRQIGQGGMGQVWLGQRDGARVAIKLLRSRHEGTAHRDFNEAFGREVLSMARLHHPFIARIFDAGFHTDETQRDCPHIIMEYVEGQPLNKVMGELDWPRIKRGLLALLAALAHAHALDVIHLDIKPQNVIVSRDQGVSLLDFGIARFLHEHLDTHDEDERIIGTPRYMAPEQITLARRKQGPWTDLYAIGCLVWEIVCGTTPFDGKDVTLLYKHVRAPLPAFVPLIPVPPGLEIWLRRLLAKDPRRRFQRASWAAWALTTLGDAPSVRRAQAARSAHQRSPSGELDPDRTVPIDLDATSILSPTLQIDAEAEPEQVREQERAMLDIMASPPIPRHWKARSDAGPLGSTSVNFAGLGLWGVRIVPLVGRTHERDVLWSAFAQVASTKAPQSVILRGQAGSGKSRLAQWICRRAHERGTGHVMMAAHSQEDGSDAVAAMLRRGFRCEGLRGEALITHLKWVLGSHPQGVSPHMLATLLQASHEDTAGSHQLVDSKTRAEIIRRALLQLSEGRPIVIWLDDVQWGSQSMLWARELLTASDPPPVLCVMTIRDDGLEAGHWVFEAMRELEALPVHAATVALESLDEARHIELVEKMLGLSPSLARHVAARTQGNPLFATQLVNHWVARGELMDGEQGLDVQEGALLELPDDIYELWNQRIEHLVLGFGEGNREEVLGAVSLAAVLGDRVSQDEWERLCQGAQVRMWPGLVARMLARGLAAQLDGGWMFTHGMLREALARRAREQRQWVPWNELAERVLASASSSLESVSRRAYHCMESCQWERAFELYDQTVQFFIESGYTDQLRHILVQMERCLSMLELDEGSRLGVRLMCSKARATRIGAFERAPGLELAQRAAELSLAHGYSLEWADARAACSVVWGDMGDYAQAVMGLQDATEQYERLGKPLQQARSALRLGVCLDMMREFDGALKTLSDILPVLKELGDVELLAKHHQARAGVFMALNKIDEAAMELEHASEFAARSGNPLSVAHTWNMRGHLFMAHDDLPNARRAYTRASELYGNLVEIAYLVSLTNLGTLDLFEHDYTTCKARMSYTNERVSVLGFDRLRAGPVSALICCAAAERDWAAWDTWMDVLDPERSLPVPVRSVYWQLLEAGQLAHQQGDSDRAREALMLALEGYRFLGHTERVGEVLRALERLS